MKNTSIRISLSFVILAMILAAFIKPVSAAPVVQAVNGSTHPDASSRPVLVVNAYSVTEGRVAAGEEFVLAVELKN